MDFLPEDITMINARFFRRVGLILFFGLCIAMLSKVAPVSADQNDPKLNVSSVSIVLNETYRLRVYNLTEDQTVTYRSSNPAIAAVSATGRVTGVQCGNAVITATVRDGRSVIATLRCEVLIGPAAVSIKLTKTSIVLQVGRSKLLRTVIYPLNTVEEAKFYSTEAEVAKVSSAGRVRAASEGVTEVYALLLNGTYDICEVTVLNEENYQKYRQGASLEDLLNQDEEEPEPGESDETEPEPTATPTPATAETESKDAPTTGGSDLVSE
ncbi:MAG: Ig-like domain-containing protein [Lachnospiraceae bacterium]|nr:Ig-like domain-containing protein [Lachnospiraceae bacterium]